jgi:hypothetical protein
LFGLVIVFATFWYWSRGLYCFRTTRYESDSAPQAVGNGSVIHLRVVPTVAGEESDMGLSWHSEKEPFFVVITGDFPSDSNYESFRLLRIEVRAEDSQTAPIAIAPKPTHAATTPLTAVIGTADGIRREQYARFELRNTVPLPAEVTAEDRFTIHVKGELLAKDGTADAVQCEQRFQRSRRTGIVPYRWVIQQL